MLKRQKILLSLMIFLGSCSTPQKEIPCTDCEVWAGDSQNEGITRAQDKRTIKASDPLFDSYVCMSHEALTSMWLSCHE